MSDFARSSGGVPLTIEERHHGVRRHISFGVVADLAQQLLAGGTRTPFDIADILNMNVQRVREDGLGEAHFLAPRFER